MLKKILPILILAFVLIGMTANSALAVGETCCKPTDCNVPAGETCPGGAEGTCSVTTGTACCDATTDCPATETCNSTPATCAAAPGPGPGPAIPKISECCKISSGFTANNVNYEKGAVVGGKAGTCKGVDITNPCAGTVTTACHTKDWGLICILSTIYGVTNWVFYILLLVAVLMAVIGGFVYMTAAGDPEKAGKGKSILIFSMIGLAIALFSKALPSIVRAVMGM